MNFRQNLRENPVSFQIAPMIDIVFLLLTYFMSASIFGQLEKEIDITVPTAITGAELARQEGEVILNIDAEGTVTVNRQRLDADQLRAMLRRLAELFPGQSVILRADERTAYRHVVATLDHCRQAGIWNVSFATREPPGETPANEL